MAKANWIAGAIKRPGSLTAFAKQKKAMKKGGGINLTKLSKVKNLSSLRKRQIALAKTLSKMRSK